MMRIIITLSLLAVTVLSCLTSPPFLLGKNGAGASAVQAGWRVQLEEGQTTRATLTINNRCSEPHLFRIESKLKGLSFEQPTNSVLIAAASSKQLGARFDATGLKSKVHTGKVVVECLDCKKSRCTQDRDEVKVELTVTKVTNRDDQEKLPPNVTEARLSNDQLKRVTSDEKFRAALEVVAEQNETVNLKSARLLTSPSVPGLSEVAFRVTVKGTHEPGEYAKLIYSEQPGEPPFVFFDEKRTVGITASPSGQQGGQGGGVKLRDRLACLFKPWEPWTVLNNFCKYNFWCPLRRQQALYLTEMRIKKCPNGSIQTQTRTIKAHCGC